MKYYKYLILVTYLFSGILMSCNTGKDVFSKRKYRNGYYVQSPFKSQGKAKINTHENANSVLLNASTIAQSGILKPNQIKEILKANESCSDSLQNEECDIIVLKNGEEVKAKVMEIGADDIIKYKRCDNLNGPMILIKKSTVFMIKYPNGIKEIIKSTETAPIVQKQEKIESPNENNTNKESNISIYKNSNNDKPKPIGYSVGSFASAMIALFSPTLGIALVFSLAALVFGIIGMIKGKLKGLAITGAILGGVMLFILAIAILVLGMI